MNLHSLWADNLQSLAKWKHYELLLQNHTILHLSSQQQQPITKSISMQKCIVFCDAPQVRYFINVYQSKIARENQLDISLPDTVLNIWREVICYKWNSFRNVANI